jgi:hypothetical protein
MKYLAGILAAIASVFYGLYQLGPGINKRREKKKNEEWTRKWKNMHGGSKK